MLFVYDIRLIFLVQNYDIFVKTDYKGKSNTYKNGYFTGNTLFCK